MIYGYGRLARTLLEHGLVDRLNFVVNPVLVGNGTPLSHHGKHTNLRLVSVTERRNGVVTLSCTSSRRGELNHEFEGRSALCRREPRRVRSAGPPGWLRGWGSALANPRVRPCSCGKNDVRSSRIRR